MKARDADRVVCFAVRLSAMLRVKPFAASDEGRYYLTGVFVEPADDGGALCVATDGHALGLRRDPGGIVNEPQICRLPSIAKETGWPGRVTWAVMVREGAASYLALVDCRPDQSAEMAISHVDQCRLRIGDVLIEGTYPDYKRVVPAPHDDDAVRTFQTRHLAGFGERITLRGPDAASPHLVFDLEDENFVGVQMPMKLQGEVPPEWIGAVAQAVRPRGQDDAEAAPAAPVAA